MGYIDYTTIEITFWHTQKYASRDIDVVRYFNDSHSLQLWSDTVPVRRRMIHGLDAL